MLAAGWSWLACQPVIIGLPADAVGGAATGGSSTLPDAGSGTDTMAGTPPVSSGGSSLADAGEPSRLAGEAGATTQAGAAGGSDEGGAGASTGCSLQISGAVVSLRAHPIAFAQLKLSGPREATTRSDENGHYVFSGLCAGKYQVTPVCLTSSVSFDLTEDRTLDFAGEPGKCDLTALKPRLKWVMFDPVASEKDGIPQRLTTTLEIPAPERTGMEFYDSLVALTNGHVQPQTKAYTITHAYEFPLLADGYRYTKEEYASCLANPSLCHAEVELDYDALVQGDALCESVAQENVDEIWLLGAAHFGLAPLKTISCPVVIDGKYVDKKVDLVGLHYDRLEPPPAPEGVPGPLGMMSDYQARALAALVQTFGPVPGDSSNPLGWFTQVLGQTPDATASGCGGLDFPPNGRQAGRFDDTRSRPSFCNAFGATAQTSAPLGAAVATSCAAWGCTELGYRRYWLSHLPRASWLDKQGRLNDYWRYVIRATERADPNASAVTCSSEYEPGWCARAVDGKNGSCNDGEWATASETTGQVELLFRPPRFVTSVALYDRACNEQVKAGHLEFSDGSEDIPFSMLENSGRQATTLSFEPKQLTGLRVVIDQGELTNPGIGEIVLGDGSQLLH
jgi:hypothetical protein